MTVLVALWVLGFLACAAVLILAGRGSEGGCDAV